MSYALNGCPTKSKIRDLVAGLSSLENEPITSARVLEYMRQVQPSVVALTPYLLWNRDYYTRNLLYRDDFFEVIALCWLPGQRTPIHSHDGQLGWMTVLQGELACRDYVFVRPGFLKKPPSSSANCADGSRPVEVQMLNTINCRGDGTVMVVDRRRTTHQIENIEKSPLGSVSLHVYSKPIDSCVLFDEATRRCERRQLQYDSVQGVPLARPLETEWRPGDTAA
jgi:cysteine dioxygenase